MVEYLDLLMCAALVVGILAGYPVLFTLSGIAFLFAFLGTAFGVFEFSLLGALSQRLFGIMTNNVLIAIPLFVFMGVTLEKSQVAARLLEEMGKLFGSVPGGLAVSVVLVGALLAASTGIVGATVVTMGLIALPTMLRHGYDPRLASGTVCTAGTLGQIIPPSTLLIILSEVMSNAYQQAQFKQGKFSVETISVGQIFAGALLPGLVLVGLYVLYLLVQARALPKLAPAMRRDSAARFGDARLRTALLPPILLIVAVLGSILGGVATPTEAAAVGAVGALLLAGFHLPVPNRSPWLVAGTLALASVVVIASVATIRLQRSDAGVVDWMLGGAVAVLLAVAAAGITDACRRTARADVLRSILTDTMAVTAMIFGTIIGASVFSLVFRGLGGDLRIEALLAGMPGGAGGALLFVMALIFVLGFFLDFVEITIILLPIVAPVLILLGHDPIWLSILIAINLQTSFLTPPFGFSLFYLRGAAPPEITTGQIYAGVIPFIAVQIVGMGVLWFWQDLAVALPRYLFG